MCKILWHPCPHISIEIMKQACKAIDSPLKLVLCIVTSQHFTKNKSRHGVGGSGAGCRCVDLVSSFSFTGPGNVPRERKNHKSLLK